MYLYISKKGGEVMTGQRIGALQKTEEIDTMLEACSGFESAERSQVLGINHILEELDVYIEYLKNYEVVDKMNASISPGILFSGEPGTGKTLCARYVATQSGACFVDVQKFINISPDDGVSTKIIEDLFSLARKYVDTRKKPMILFWDEVEAYLTEEDIVSQLKTELSGAKGRLKGVFLLATTNKVAEIDETLLRAGRIGKKFHFSPPNHKAKLELLRYYAHKYNSSDDIDYESIVHIIKASAVPTDIEEAVNNAWNKACLSAIAKNEDIPELTQDMLVDGLLEELMGPSDNTTLSKEKLREIDIYLVGKALVARTLGHPVQAIVFPRVGYDSPEFVEEFEDQTFLPIETIKERIVVKRAGREAHKLFGIKPNLQWENDFDYATGHAHQIIERFNGDMKGLSLYSLAASRENIKMPPTMGLSSKKLTEIVQDIDNIIKDSEQKAANILKHYGKDTILALIKLLNKRGYIVQAEIDEHIEPYGDIRKVVEKKEELPDTAKPPGQYL
ncbi:MAG: AAA family ATPase [Candidatus Spechtbacterales bacterium]